MLLEGWLTPQMNSSSLQVSENGTLVASKLKHPLSVGWGEFLVLNSCVLNMYSLEISAVDISYLHCTVPPTKSLVHTELGPQT